MIFGVRADAGPRLRHKWLFTMVVVLALVVLSVAYVQWRQYKLLDTASHFQSEALGWSFAQLETEQLRLRSELQRFLADPQHAGADQVQLRYDIFVSRVGLVDHDRAADIMRDQPAYQPAMAQVNAFVKRADTVLGPRSTPALDAVDVLPLMATLEALNAPLHELSLGAAHLLYQRATERNAAVRQQSVLGVALTAFQVVLLLALAFIVLRQLRTLTERRRRLEALAESLGAARVDAEASNRAKSAFLANMSHEIRTPFHGMLGMMSLLHDSGLSAKQALYLDTARESAHHLLAILNDILDISQLESGKLQVTPQAVDLMQLLEQVDALMRAQASAKGLALRIDVAADVPRWVRADPTRVRQILCNLLGNALKFTSVGEIVLALTNGSAGRLEFKVSDCGIGMDDATQARLFQRFMQGDERPSHRASGSGLGLEISRDLARLMGGDITVRSHPGQGSTFTVSLPLASVGAPVSGPDDPACTGRATRLRVLVAEDHAVNRAYLEAVLEKLGHHGVFVGDGHGAVQAVQMQPPDEPFDIVLMDLHMPDMDGFTAARTIRAMPPPKGRVPIVALTADAFQTSRELAREAGMEGFLTKPAHLPQLREALQRYGAGSAAALPELGTTAEAAAGVETLDSLLDMATIADVTHALSPPKYAALLSRYFDERSATLAALRQAAADASRPGLHSRAHALKGASASLGLSAIAALAHHLETGASASRPDDLARLLDRLEAVFELSLAECRTAGLLKPPAAPAPA
jgi:signal transduction histidine kinase/CheY-like chemotaxis protein/HPt (histidine-containing phosphotransfer) domain-containing protein